MIPEITLATYLNILIEIRFRLEAIDVAINNVIPLRNKIKEDLCYIQLRMICELIAIGCLVVHQDIPATKTKDMQKTYKADWIMNKMSGLHPMFYPMALEPHDSAGPNNMVGWNHKTSGFLTREELIALDRLAGERLHRGSAKNLFKNDPRLTFPAYVSGETK